MFEYFFARFVLLLSYVPRNNSHKIEAIYIPLAMVVSHFLLDPANRISEISRWYAKFTRTIQEIDLLPDFQAKVHLDEVSIVHQQLQFFHVQAT